MTEEPDARSRLLAVRQKVLDRLRKTQSTERADVQGDSTDGAQLWEVSEIRDGLDDEAAAELKQVDEALARLETGDYGSCESCGKPIGEKRLAALPYATLCVPCAERQSDA